VSRSTHRSRRTVLLPTLLATLLQIVLADGVSALQSDPTARRSGPSRVLSAWRSEPPSEMPLPVIAAAAVEIGDRLHLLGGLDRDFEATAVIQSRRPGEEWRPIGDRLAKPRAEPSALRLADGRVLLLGGFEGSLSEPSWHDDGELVDPAIAGSAVELPPFGTSLEGHSVTPLPDGTALVVAGRIARRLDPNAAPEELWGPAATLPESRRRHAAVRLDDRRVLIACGVASSESAAPALRVVEIPRHPTAPPAVLDAPPAGAADLPSDLRDAGAARDPDSREILLAGGFDPVSKRSVRGTWWIDVDRNMVRPGLPLPGMRGAARLHLVETDGGIAMIGGEWRTPAARGPVDLGLLATGGAEVDRRLGLAPLPVSGTRRMRILADGIALIGGYRYRSPDEAAATGLPAGVHFDTRRYRLSLAHPGGGD